MKINNKTVRNEKKECVGVYHGFKKRIPFQRFGNNETGQEKGK